MPYIDSVTWDDGIMEIRCYIGDVPNGDRFELEIIGLPYSPTNQVYTSSGSNYATIFRNRPRPCVTSGTRIRKYPGGSWSSTYYDCSPSDPSFPETHYPSYYPQVTDQHVWDRFNNRWHGEAGSCVANALATVKEIHEYMEGKGSRNEYSIGWIYGNRLSSHNQNEGMYYDEALDMLKTDGVPDYKFLSENSNYRYGDYYYPDVYYYTNSAPTGVTAKQLVSNNYNDIIDYAKPQRISSYLEDVTWDIDGVMQRVLEDGCVFLTMDLYDNFYNEAWDDGIISQYKSGSFVDGHGMVIIGWRKIGDIWYWIVHNNWGEGYGDDGLLYIPFYHDFPSSYYYIRDGEYPYPTPPVPTAPLIDYRLEGGYRVYWGASSGAADYTLRVRRGYDDAISTFITSNTYYNVTGLQYGVTHYISVKSSNDNGDSGYSPENPATTAPKTPTATASNITSASISITVSGMINNFDNINVSGWRGTSSSGTSIGTKTITKVQYDSGNRVVTFSGLSSGQDYYFEAQSNFAISGTTLWSVNVDTVSAYTSARPNDWTWTAAELSIFNNGGEIEDISYLR
ncbi:MAG: C1 family peptidase, partial [Bacillota bacterium]